MARQTTPEMTAAWLSPNKTGSRRPVVRATIQRQHMTKFDYDTAWAQGGTFDKDKHRNGRFTSIIFGDDTAYREIPNIISCSWERSVDKDAATCTVVLKNTEIQPIGAASDGYDEDFDLPGYLTYNRGDPTLEDNRWGYEETGWKSIFVPDMIVKTYEGYGCDPDVTPSADPHLMQSGMWMIDKVTYDSDDATITLEMRDLARLLLDAVVFPPAVPFHEYPLYWSALQSEFVPARDAKGGEWRENLKALGRAESSNAKYIGKNFTNEPFKNYVMPNGGVDGNFVGNPIRVHESAEDDPTNQGGDRDVIWMSTGQDSEDAFVWWQFEADQRVPVAALRLSMKEGPYRVFISVHDGTKWLGRKKIDWSKDGVTGSPGNVNIDADIPFVTSIIADRQRTFDVTLPKAYMAKRIRLTFTRLYQAEVGEHPYRASLREMKIYTAKKLSDLSFEKGKILKVVGNYGDYSHIVKWMCAWAGWYWPPHSTEQDFIRTQGGPGDSTQRTYLSYDRQDPVLPAGRVWGDFMQSGTVGEADLRVEMFDKKPLMDVINYVRDLLGYLFFVDEYGGVVWRMPNIWGAGNYISPGMKVPENVPSKRGRYGRTSEIVTLDEEQTLLGYSTILDSTNIRERIFVANHVGGMGVVIAGFNPYRIGLRRTAGYTDQHFKNKRETVVMADMINARSMFTYRTSRATIPGYPKIQIDDQIRIYERVTNETYYHYVMGIKSELNMEEGEWTYDLATHWLGEKPEDAWVVDVKKLSKQTRAFLYSVGYRPESDEDNDGDVTFVPWPNAPAEDNYVPGDGTFVEGGGNG